MADCAQSLPFRPLAVAAVGISWRGRTCWETSVTGPPAAGLFHSSAGPLYDDGMVILSSDGQVLGVSPVDGRPLWSWASGGHGVDSDGYGPGGYLVGATGGVVVTTKGQSYVGLDTAHGTPEWTRTPTSTHVAGPVLSGQGGLVLGYPTGQVSELIDIRSGRIAWRDPQTTPSQSSGVPMQEDAYWPVVAGGTIVAPQTDHSVIGYDLGTGRVIWTNPGPALEVTAAGSDAIFTPAPGQSAGAYDVRATAVDAASGRKLWEYGPLDPGAGRFTEIGGALIYTNSGTPGQTGLGPGGAGKLARIDPATGRDMWAVSTSPFKVATAGNEIISLESATYSTGSTSDYALVGRDLNSGRTMWSTPGASGYGSANQLLIVPTPGGPLALVVDGLKLTAYSAGTGREAWTASMPGNYVVDGVEVAGSGVVIQVSDSRYQLEGH